MKTSPNPIRILHLIASNFVGGPEKQILHHARDIREAGVEAWIGSFRDQLEKAEILIRAQEHGLPIYESRSSGRFDLRAVWELASFLKEQNIRLLCTHGFKANTIGALAKKLARVPQIAFCRGWTAETLRVRAYEYLDRRLLPLADRIVCVSEAQAELLSRNSQLRPRVAVVRNAMLAAANAAPAANREVMKAQLGFSQQTKLIGAIGRLSVEKGQRFLVEAAVELAREFPELKIVLLGEGRDRAALEAQIKRLGLDGIVLLPGFQKNVADWMRALDVLANCSLTEGIPNVILEALAAETPVVATAVGGVPELIYDRQTGLLVPAGDAASLGRALSAVLHDPELGGVLSQAGRAWVQTRFSPIQQRESLLAIYRQCLGDPPLAVAPLREEAIQEHTEITSAPGAESCPFVSVVIPVRNEEKHLGITLDGLLNQDYPEDRYEILVVDGDSTDKTPQIVEEATRTTDVSIQLLQNSRRLSSAGRNVGVRHSRGSLIVFIDGHCHIPSRGLLRDTARLFSSTGAACLCRPQPLTAPGSSAFQTVVADARSSLIGHGLDSTIYSTNLEGFVDPTSSGASYRREVFERVGLYNEELDACEDVDFNYRVLQAGLSSYISPKLTIQYHARNSISRLWNQMVRYGKGRCRFVRLHPEAFSLAGAMPAVFIAWIFLGLLLTPISKYGAYIYLATLGVYLGAVLASSAQLGIRRGWRHLVAAPGIYATIHLGLGFGFLADLLTSLRRSSPSGEGRNEKEGFSEDIQSKFSNTLAGRMSARVSAANIASPAAERQQSTHDFENQSATLNAFTVDVEDYFHTEAMTSAVSREDWKHLPSRVQSSTYRLFELMAAHDVRGTFFFLGWIAERFPGLVREAVKLGHEVGCHSYWHRPIFRLSPDEFHADTLRAKRAIEDAGGMPIRGYRAPSFSMVPGTDWAADVLADLGFVYDSSVHPIRHDIYDNATAPRVPHRISAGAILELPIATCRWGGNNLPIGGGGYLRMLPYRYSRWGLRRYNQEAGHSAVVYLHPWEIDALQPRLPASQRARFRQYTGLRSMESKLSRMLRDFRFAPVCKVFEKELAESSTAQVVRAPDHKGSFRRDRSVQELRPADSEAGR